MPLLITFLLGLFFLFGTILTHIGRDHTLIEKISIIISAIALLVLMFFDLIPEAIEEYPFPNLWKAALFTLIGFLLLMGFDRFVPEHGAEHSHKDEGMIHIGIMSAIAIILHNILEGMSVYSMLQSDLSLGFSLCIGIGLHNIPMGMLIFTTLKKENRPIKYVILIGAVISTFVGGLMMMIFGMAFSEAIHSPMICVTLGMVIYILAFELIPSLISFYKRP